jgi:hypothetical protein
MIGLKMIDAIPRHYGQYEILVRVWPTPANMYQSSFTVHKREPGPGSPHLPQVHEEGREGGMTCVTQADAEHDAWERATFWIDRQAS